MANRIKLKSTSVQGKVPSTTDIETGELAINTNDGKIFFERDDSTIQSAVTTNSLTTGSVQLKGPFASHLNGQYDLTSSIIVTATTKTSNHRYSGQGSPNGYYFNGIESPYITLYPGKSYIFDWSGATSHPVAFYTNDTIGGGGSDTPYTTGVSTTGNKTQIDVTEDTPSILYYFCTAHTYMGNAAHIQSAATASHALTASFVSGLTGTNSGDVTLTGIPNYITIAGQQITRNQIDLANDVTGILPSANLDGDTAHLTTDQTFTGRKTFSAAITASANISGSGLLFISASESSDTSYKTVVRDPVSGRLYTTGSFSGGGTGGTTVVGNPGGTPTTQLTTITIGTNNFSVGGTSGNTFPFTGDAQITGSLKVTGSSNSSIFIVDGRSFFKDQVTFGNNLASDVVSFGARVSTNIEPVALGTNNERLGTDAKPWYGATITTITSSLVSINESASLSRKNNTLEIGNDSKWSGFTYGSSTTPQTHGFSGDVNITGTKSLSVARHITLNGNITASAASGFGNITAGGNISGSGELYFSSSLNSDTNLKTVVIDTTTGKLFHTGSYSSGGTSGPSTGLSSETKIFVWYQGMT